MGKEAGVEESEVRLAVLEKALEVAVVWLLVMDKNLVDCLLVLAVGLLDGGNKNAIWILDELLASAVVAVVGSVNVVLGGLGVGSGITLMS